MLVVFQFALATAFIAGTLVLVAQTRHLRQADLGFARDGLIVVKSLAGLSEGQQGAMRDAIADLPMIRSVGLPTAPPGLWQQQRQQHRDTRARRPWPSLREIVVGKGFFTTYGARVIAGRQFDDAHGADDSYGTKSSENRAIMINRTAVPVLGFRSAQDAVGKTLGKGRPRTIIGVVDDMRFYSPHVPMDATYYTYFSHYLGAPVITRAIPGAWMPRWTRCVARGARSPRKCRSTRHRPIRILPSCSKPMTMPPISSPSARFSRC
jgi:putative ABC transport system permease protein